MAASAFSNASIDITPTSDYAGTIFTSATGHVYSGEASTTVPDTASTLALLGLGLGGLGFVNRRLRRTQTV